MNTNPWLLARFEQAGRLLYWLAGAMAGLELVGGLAGSRLILGDETQVFSVWGSLILATATVTAYAGLTRPLPPTWTRYSLSAVALLGAALVIRFLTWATGAPGGVTATIDRTFSNPSPNLALVISLVAGGALGATFTRRSLRAIGQGATVAGGIITAIVLVGFAYGDRDAGGFPLGGPEATIPSAIASLLLVGAVLCSRPGQGLMRPVVSSGVGGVLLRRIVPLVLLAPAILIGLLVFRTRFDAPGTLALVAVTFTATMAAGLIALARSLDRFHTNHLLALEQADRATTALTQVAPVITDLDRVLSLIEVERMGRIQVAARYSAASGMLAGDSMAVFPIDDSEVGLVMVDGAGHGAQPALQALRLRDSLVQAIRLGVTPAEAISSATWLVDGPGDMATVAVMVADTTTGKVRLSLAGHPPPLLDRGVQVSPLEVGGPLLHPEVAGRWTDQELELLPGHKLIFFTDGIADVFPRGADVDGITELASLLQRLGPASADTAADACLGFAAREVGRRDDRAVVVLAIVPD